MQWDSDFIFTQAFCSVFHSYRLLFIMLSIIFQPRAKIACRPNLPPSLGTFKSSSLWRLSLELRIRTKHGNLVFFSGQFLCSLLTSLKTDSREWIRWFEVNKWRVELTLRRFSVQKLGFSRVNIFLTKRKTMKNFSFPILDTLWRYFHWSIRCAIFVSAALRYQLVEQSVNETVGMFSFCVRFPANTDEQFYTLFHLAIS